MKIGFEFIVDETPLMISVAEKLRREYSIEIIGVTLGNRFKHLLRNKKFTLVNLGEFLNTQWEHYKVTEKEMLKLEERYGDTHNLRLFVDADRFTTDINKHKFPSKEKKLKLLCLHFKFWEEFFDKFSCDYFYSTGAAFLSSLISIAVAQRRGVKYRLCYAASFNEPRVVFVKNYFDKWEDVNELYERVKKYDAHPENFDEAMKFISHFRQQPARPSFSKAPKFYSSATIFAKEFFRRLKWIYVDGWGRGRCDYITPPLFGRVFLEAKVILKRKWLNFYFHSNALRIPPNNVEYVFLPLQIQPEATCDIWGMYFSHQIAFIENVAKSLPFNVILCVKEHPYAMGRRKGLKGYYQAIRRLSNVELVHPLADTYEFIKNAKAVVINSSTVGWEALLLKRPVIAFGEAFYNHSSLLYKLDTFSELKKTLKQILSPEWQFPKDYDEKLTKFVYALKEKTFPGLINAYYWGERELLSEKNVENIYRALAHDCGLRSQNGAGESLETH
ncbi:MAG: hypothetical protein JSW40_00740 [Candidatus Omnitrophota bacterium]|nr:MAG: hypothetical protein JSW40_00740 [Candidatus Omnitrophota bacterium]